MSGSWKRVDVQCPFYKQDDFKRKILCCEAVTDEEFPSQRHFMRRDDMEKHMDRYCLQSFKYCEHYRMLMQYKYNEEE